MKTRRGIAALTSLAVGSLISVGAIAYGVERKSTVGTPSTSAAPSLQSADTTSGDDLAEVHELLAYLAEEEKLAGDLYTVLGEQWGTRVFENISASESRHQASVIDLLSSYGMADPRSPEVGVFANADLQALYDELLAQGMRSPQEAYQVGILVEQTDLGDLDAFLSDLPEGTGNIEATLDDLRAGSQRHLAAFSRLIV